MWIQRTQYKKQLAAFLGLVVFALPLSVSPAANALEPRQAIQVYASPYDPENAPPSKYIKKVTETTTTENLNLRKSPSTSAVSLGVMKKGQIVKLTGKKQGTWSQLTWGSKTGWSATQYLKTRTYIKDESRRYMGSYASIKSTSSLSKHIGAVNFRTPVQLLEMVGGAAHIKTAYYHGWVDARRITTTQPAKIYRFVQKSGPTYARFDTKVGSELGRIHHAEKLEYRRWVGSTQRAEVLVNGRWVWTSVTGTTPVSVQYRYAQKDGNVYSSSNPNTSKVVGTIKRGAKVRWGAWDSKNRRDEVLVGGKWVWTNVTAKTKPPGYVPPTVNVKDYGRYTTKALTLLKQPISTASKAGTVKKGMKVTVMAKADGGWVQVKVGSVTGYVLEKGNLQVKAPYSVAVYGTLRTGQSAYNVMGGFQQKNMNQRIAKTSLYQLWNPNWTFLTNGTGTVVAEQFQYSDAAGPGILKKLDIYESQLKYQGKPMYTRQNVTMSDGSQSWTYKTTAESEKVVKQSGRYISSGDFLKRS